MAANVPDPVEREREREQPRFTSAPKTCPLDDCKDPAKCLFKHAGDPFLSYCSNGESCHQADTFMGIRALIIMEVNSRMAAVLPCERAAVQLILKSTGQICEEYGDDDILLYPAYNGTGNEMAIARAARDAMSKHGHDDLLPKTTLGSIDGPELLRIISGSCKLTPSDFAGPSTVILTCKDLQKFAHGYYYLTTSGSSKLGLPEFAGISTVGSRLEGMMPLVCAADARLMAGGGSAQTGPDHHGMVEPDDLKLDSGASNHVVGEKTLLEGYQSLPRPWRIHVADGYPLEVVGVGSIKTKEFFITEVYCVKALKSNLISVSQLATKHGLLSVFDGVKCEVLKRNGERVGGGFLQANGIYKLSFLEVPDADGGYERA